jgi:transcriptional regulator with XRE-family HTH domain
MGGPDQPQAALGVAVRKLREKRGLTQEGLAQKAGITTGTVSLIERGQSNPAWGTVKAIAAALDLSLASLARAEEQQHQT